jgi:hypothetical protein
MLIANQFNVTYTAGALGQNSTIVTRARSTTRLAVHPKHVHTTLVTFLCAAANAEQQQPRLCPGLKKKPAAATVGRVPLHRVFADRTDAALMAVGAVAALANGMAQPLMTFIIGDVIDAFGSSANVLHRVVKVRNQHRLQIVPPPRDKLRGCMEQVWLLVLPSIIYLLLYIYLEKRHA